MSYKIRADLDAALPIVVQGKNTGTSVSDLNGNSYSADDNGECKFPVLTTDEFDYITNGFPVSQFGNMYDTSDLGFSASNYNLVISKSIPLFLSGSLYNLPTGNVRANTVTSGTVIQYVYVTLELGIPKYVISLTQRPESNINMFIGTVNTTTAGIVSISISKVSRFDDYRPSTTRKGSSFPVSTGNPAQTGSIGW